jgi:hypothetical protein
VRAPRRQVKITEYRKGKEGDVAKESGVKRRVIEKGGEGVGTRADRGRGRGTVSREEKS